MPLIECTGCGHGFPIIELCPDCGGCDECCQCVELTEGAGYWGEEWDLSDMETDRYFWDR